MTSSNLAIKVENLSKLYRLGEVGTGTLAHDLNRWWSRLRTGEDLHARIGSTNDRETAGGDYVWALRNVDLEVARGEIVGVIGRNGSGKSTLLKLLSRVTAPTEGEIRINGRIASLLEVGTGFHPELTGRENIFLNGTIMGMNRREIRRKFDEIVAFSGCAKYIDTPVKRYSSGMNVRLGFAVAAHLEPDILIVDEVLAVGDAEFQSKCLGKMKDFSVNSGRTVLFVSHNMAAVRQLCPQSILLDKGMITSAGSTSNVIEDYLSASSGADRLAMWTEENAPRTPEIILHRLAVTDAGGATNTTLETGGPINVEIDYTLNEAIKNLRIVCTIYNSVGIAVFSTSDYSHQPTSKERPAGLHRSTCHIPPNLMTVGGFTASVDFEIPMERSFFADKTVSFQITDLSLNQLGRTQAPAPQGVVHPRIDWTVARMDACI